MENRSEILVTILIPSHKEGDLVRKTVETAKAELQKLGISAYELLISNCYHEGDVTESIGQKLAQSDPHVRFMQRKECWNFGRHYRTGIAEARGDYFMCIPGDNEILPDAIYNVLKELGKYDVVISYTANPEARPWFRQIISSSFAWICRFISGLPLKYFNGINLYRTDLLRSITIKTDGFAYSAEILMKLITTGKAKTWIEVPMPINPPEPGRTSAAFKWRNIKAVTASIFGLFWAVKVKGDALGY